MTLESDEMILLTLRRLDESILIAPHMIDYWKRLLDRLAQLNPGSAIQYTADMSLHWNPYYSHDMIQNARKKHAGHVGLEDFISFISLTQTVGNEIDAYGTDTFINLIASRSLTVPANTILSLLLKIFPTSIFSEGFCRTP